MNRTRILSFEQVNFCQWGYELFLCLEIKEVRILRAQRWWFWWQKKWSGILSLPTDQAWESKSVFQLSRSIDLNSGLLGFRIIIFPGRMQRQPQKALWSTLKSPSWLHHAVATHKTGSKLWHLLLMWMQWKIPVTLQCNLSFLLFPSWVGPLPSLLLKHWWRIYVFLMKCVFRRSYSDVKPNSLFLWGLPSASCSDNNSNTDVTLPGVPCPFGQTLLCLFRSSDPSSPPVCPPLGFWRSRARSALLGYCREFSDRHICRNSAEESGTWRKTTPLCRAADSFGTEACLANKLPQQRPFLSTTWIL